MNKTAKCFECNGKAKKDGLFYVCEDCGITTTMQEFARQRDQVTHSRWQSEIDSDDVDGKRKRQSDMMKWYLKQGD